MKTSRKNMKKQRTKYIKTLISLGIILGAQIKYDKITNSINAYQIERIKDNQDEYTPEEILDGIENNINLTEEEKQIFREFKCVIEDNPFILSKETYNSISSVDIEYGNIDDYILNVEDEDTKIVGLYIYDMLKIIISEDDIEKSTIQHEAAHCIFENIYTLDLPIYFVEGVTELLINEYFMNEPYIEFISYPFEISMIKLLCNMVGPNKVLEAYTIGDMNIIKEELVIRASGEGNDKEKAAEQFLKDINKVFTSFEEKDKIPKNSYQNIFKYLNAFFLNNYEMNSNYMDEFFYYRGIIGLMTEETPYSKLYDYIVENGYYERPYFSAKLREEKNIESIKDEYNKQKVKEATGN